MADAKAPKVGETFFFLGRTRCTVNGLTLEPGGVNRDTALIEVKTVQGTPYTFLYKNAAQYLSEKQIGILQKWPPTPDVNR